jgi:hypothetical protein
MIRIATWNIEWFTGLFDASDRLLLDNEPSARYHISRRDQIQAIADVMRALDADLLIIIEAPNTGSHQSTVKALEGFAKLHRLRQTKALIGYPNDTEQEIAALYDPTKVALRHDPQGTPSTGNDGDPAPRFDSRFRLDVDLDGSNEIISFNKPPLELTVTTKATNTMLRLIGVHAKSKAPHGAHSAKAIAELSIANRREHLAQCIWLRRRIDAHLDAKDPLIVLGDFNDGPGLDGYEKLFGRSGLEVVLGDAAQPDRYLTEPHARIRLDPRQGWALSTARFYNVEHKLYINALLDYVMLSPNLAASANAHWRIWHPFDDPACFDDRDLREALLTASDHFPVSVDLEV